MHFARKIRRSKWELASASLSAHETFEMVASDLNAIDSALSFWECGEALEADLADVVIALATAKGTPEKIDLVWISEESLRQCGIDWSYTEGRTPVAELRRLHITLRDLNEEKLISLASAMKAAYEAGQTARFTRSQVRSILHSAEESGRLDPDDLGPTSVG